MSTCAFGRVYLQISKCRVVNLSHKARKPCQILWRYSGYVYMDDFCLNQNEILLIDESERSIYMNAI